MARVYSDKERAKWKEYKLWANYRIRQADYDRMYDAQGGMCFICHRPGAKHGKGRKGSLHVDHNHATGKVRALLCYACNGLIGLAGESEEVLVNSINYLKMFG